MTIADDESGDGVVDAPSDRWLTPGVGAVGAASFFSDSGHEMTTSLLPAFLTGTLGASAAALGVIDGISDALIGVMKLIGGPLANDPRRRARTADGGLSGHCGGDGSDRCGDNRMAGRCTACDRMVVPGFTISGPRCVTGFSSPDISAGEGFRARKGGRQPWRGRGSVARGRLGDVGRCSASAISGGGSGFVCGNRDHRGGTRVPAQGAQWWRVPAASA